MAKMTDTAAAAAIGTASRELRLPVVRTDAARLAEIAQRSQMSYMAFLADVLTADVDERAERRRQRRITEARFPRTKRLADFDLGAAPTINPASIATLASCAYLDSGEPIVLLGDSGTGKSHLLIGRAWPPASKAAGSATPPPPSSSMSSPRPPTNGGSRASSPATDGSTCSAWTSSAMSSSMPATRNCCSRSSPNARRTPASPWPATSPSANGAPSSPTPASSPPSSSRSPSNAHIIETGTDSYRLHTHQDPHRPQAHLISAPAAAGRSPSPGRTPPGRTGLPPS
jgi:hypothetical protein